MDKTALNIIAIGVFCLTLSALLGPLLNISPLIPSITTAGILGLAAVDTLTLQSKGVTILLDSLAPLEHRQRIVHHEAGHFLVAYLLGIPIAGYTLSAWETFKEKQSGSGGVIVDSNCLTEELLNPQEKQLMIERLSTVWVAGIAAEKMIYGTSTGGEDDIQRVRNLLFSSGLSLNSSRQKENWLLLQANNLVRNHQIAYHALVEKMEKRASVQECYQAIADTIQGTQSE
jgi:hypothetical protein